MSSGLQLIDLVVLGNAQAVDTDYLLADIAKGSLLLLNQRPQASYPWEQHGVAERILVLQGEVGIGGEDGVSVRAKVGQMIVVHPAYRHAYLADSDGVVAVLFGGEA